MQSSTILKKELEGSFSLLGFWHFCFLATLIYHEKFNVYESYKKHTAMVLLSCTVLIYWI